LGGDSIGSGRVESVNPWPGRYRRAVEAGLAASKSGSVRSLKDMTPEEIAALELRYGAKVKPQ
jgi:hypothetical protein